MEKIIKILLIIGFLVIIGMFLTITLQLNGKTIEEKYTYTKAICNETNFCQDHVIACENKELTSIKPITGAVIQHSENWEDPRDKESIETLCW